MLLIKIKFSPDNTNLCLAVLDGVLCMIFLHSRNSPQTSPSATPCLMKSLSFEAQPEDLEEQPLSPMHYARSGLGTAALNGKLIAAGWYQVNTLLILLACSSIRGHHIGRLYSDMVMTQIQPEI